MRRPSRPPHLSRRPGALGILGSAVVLALLAGCSALFDLGGYAGGSGDGSPPSPTDGGATDGGASVPANDGSVACTADLASDPQNCGTCGRDCLGGGCVASTCTPVVIASQLQELYYLSRHDTTLYAGENRANGRLLRIALAGGAPVTDLGNVDGVFDLHASAAGVVFVSSTRSTAVRSFPASATGAGTPATLATLPTGYSVLEVEPEGTSTWVTAIADANQTPRGRLLRVRSNGTVDTIEAIRERYEGLHVDESEVFVTTWLDADTVVAFSRATGAKRVSYGTGTGHPRRIVGDATHVYIASFDDPRVVRLDKKSGVRDVVATDQVALGHADILVDATYVYWTNANAGTVERTPKSGGGPVTTLASGLVRPSGLAQDDRAIYVAVYGTQGNADAYVARIAK